MILQVSTNTELYDLKKPTHIMNEPSLKETNLAHCKGIPARLRKGKQALMYVMSWTSRASGRKAMQARLRTVAMN